MKTYKHLFEKVCCFGNLLTAFRKARRGKRCKAEVCAFEWNHESEILRLQDELLSGRYEPGPYRSFTIHEPKRRVISAAPFRDRVVHHAICNIVEPIFERSFIADSYSCRPEKGTHKALDRFTQYSRRYRFVLKADVVQYFPSVDHAILQGLLERKLADRRLMGLIGNILRSGEHILKGEYEMTTYPGDDLWAAARPRGLPIGNLTSQFFSNVYLDPLDHFVQERVRVGAYIRYCDDFVLFGHGRKELLACRDAVRSFLERLRLRLHPRKSVVYRVADGVPFLGFLMFPDRRRLLRKSVVRARRRLRQLAVDFAEGRKSVADVRQSVNAWLGHARHGDTWGLRREMLLARPFVRRADAARDAAVREDVRLESVAVSEDGRVPETVPAYADRTVGERQPGVREGAGASEHGSRIEAEELS